MIAIPALSIFVYNLWLTLWMQAVTSSLKAENVVSFWQWIHFLDRFMNSEIESECFLCEFYEFVAYCNFWINCLFLLPAFFQRRCLVLLTDFLIMWNIFIFQYVLELWINIFWPLGWNACVNDKNISTILYCCIYFTCMHAILIIKSSKKLHDLMVNG